MCSRLTSFVAKVMHEARFGEWERDLFIPLELINKMVVFLCSQQNQTTGAWDPDLNTTYDRKMVRKCYLPAAHTVAMQNLSVVGLLH